MTREFHANTWVAVIGIEQNLVHHHEKLLEKKQGTEQGMD
jgi:hypothetical protein